MRSEPNSSLWVFVAGVDGCALTRPQVNDGSPYGHEEGGVVVPAEPVIDVREGF